METQEGRRVHFNKKQMLAALVDAAEMVCVWGRGTGKSEGVIAPRSLRCAWSMPRSVGWFLAASFQQLLTKTLPPVIAGWERMGVQEGRDWVFGEKPPSWWEKPRQRRLNYSRLFSFRNGSAIMLASQETKGSLNGPSTDWGCGDEVKFWDREAYEGEALQSLRGNDEFYGKNALHHSVCLCTDMPLTASGRWILDKEKEMNGDTIECITSLQRDVLQLQAAINGGVADSTASNYRQMIARHQAYINELRKGTVYYSEASALDNIDVLGVNYLARMKKILPPFLFDVTILNKRPDHVEGGFYPGLDADLHSYLSPTTSFAENHGWLKKGEVRDYRYDARLVDTLPLDIALDYNTRFNCMAIGQLFDNRFSIDNCIYTMQKLRDLLKAFDAYYGGRKCRDVFYHFDHTAIPTSASSDNTFADEVRNSLRGRGWNVIDCNMGKAPHHHEKYVLWGRVFARDPDLPVVEFNRENCEPLMLSMALAPARQTRQGFEKDKTSERGEDQLSATHLSDAADQLLWGKLVSQAQYSVTGGGAIFG